MGLLHCLIGSIPENYQWIVNAIGINGGIDKGLNELHQLLSLTEKDEQYKIYNTELLFLISFLEMNLTIEKSNFQKTLDAIGQKHANHILLNFSAARLSSKLGKNDLVIKILNNRPKKEEQFEFSYLDYLLGMSYLYKLDFESSMKIFHHFITHFKGENYIKSAYHKLAWIAFLQGEPEKKLSYFEKAIAEGSISIDEDKVALKDAKQNYITHPILLKGRLLYDGGYYPLALAELQQIESPHLFSNTENTIEYWYRKARLFQKMEKPIMEVISSFQKALNLELTSNSYYASMSALQIAIEYEKMGEKQKAKSYYNKCLSMKDFDYQRGIHQKAKAGLNRIAN
jgi:tetratricopeptide (TPR) repeat protein